MIARVRQQPGLALLLAAGCVLIPTSRWLAAGSSGQSLDGDECIVGLMAKHAVEGRAVPGLFYGQRYGLCTFEAGLVAAGFALTGIRDATLKWAVLPLWMLGWASCVCVTHRRAGLFAAGLTGGLLLVCPAWAMWSMKARGGYLTAFALAHVAIGLVEGEAAGVRTAIRLAGAGVCASLIFWSQPLWLPGLMPFVLPALLSVPWRSGIAPFSLAMAAAGGAVKFATRSAGQPFWSPGIFDAPDLWFSIIHLPVNVWVQFTASDAEWARLPIGPCAAAAAAMWSLSLLPAAGELVRRGPDAWAPAARYRRQCAWAVAATLAASLLITPLYFSCRYLLPLGAYGAAWPACAVSAAWTARPAMRRALAAGLGILALTCAGALIELRATREAVVLPGDYRTTTAELRELVDVLEAQGVHHVYCLDAMLQWHILFESRERVTARWFDATDRVPAYPLAVDRALFRGENVALVGFSEYREELNSVLSEVGHAGLQARPATVNFFILNQPDAVVLQRLQFHLNPPVADAAGDAGGG